MKYFLSTGAFVAAVVVMLIFASDRSLTAATKAIATSSNEPIKVLGINLKTSKASTIEGLELQVQNTSAKPIQYLLVHAVVPGAKSFVRVPLGFGNVPLPNSRAKMELLQPGAKITLAASLAVCESIANGLAEVGRAPSAEEIRATINVAIFSDRSAWANGELNYPDPDNPSAWISGAEVARRKSQGADVFGVKFSKASHKAESQSCFRYIGGHVEPCCGGLYVFTADFVSDPNGLVQPSPNPACCSFPDDCCEYLTSGDCP
jgi:hypothetical protein